MCRVRIEDPFHGDRETAPSSAWDVMLPGSCFWKQLQKALSSEVAVRAVFL